MLGSNNEISIYAMVEDVNSHEAYDSIPLFSGLECYIEPLDPTVATMLDGQAAFKTFRIFIEGQYAITESHKCVDAQGREYIVRGVEQFFNNLDTGDITQLTCVSRYPQ